MTDFRISRDEEFAVPKPRSLRLYLPEAEGLVSILNAIRSAEEGGRFINLGLSCYRYRARLDPSIDEMAEDLMNIITTDVRRNHQKRWLEDVIASHTKLERTQLAGAGIDDYLDNATGSEQRPWLGVGMSLSQCRAIQRMTEKRNGPDAEKFRALEREANIEATVQRIGELVKMLAFDRELREAVVRYRCEIKEYGRDELIAWHHRALESLSKDATSSKERLARETKALGLIERYATEIELWFPMLDGWADYSVRLAVQIFESWINQQLLAAGFSFSLFLDRTTSTYRVVPPEVYTSPRRTESRDFCLVRTRTLLSARLIAYLTLSGIGNRLQEWIDGVELIHSLAFARVLTQILRCRICGRWMYVLHSRREYCGDACRYKLWAKTSLGKEKRRQASSAWRKRFSEEVRHAAPKVKRGQRNH